MEKLFLCYSKCSTCKKAQHWLIDHGLKDFTIRDIKEQKPTVAELTQWHEKSGLDIKKFFNASGLLYKEMKLKDRLPSMTLEEKLNLLSTDGMLVKRPILVLDHDVLVGFREKEWEEALGSN